MPDDTEFDHALRVLLAHYRHRPDLLDEDRPRALRELSLDLKDERKALLRKQKNQHATRGRPADEGVSMGVEVAAHRLRRRPNMPLAAAAKRAAGILNTMYDALRTEPQGPGFRPPSDEAVRKRLERARERKGPSPRTK